MMDDNSPQWILYLVEMIEENQNNSWDDDETKVWAGVKSIRYGFFTRANTTTKRRAKEKRKWREKNMLDASRLTDFHKLTCDINKASSTVPSILDDDSCAQVIKMIALSGRLLFTRRWEVNEARRERLRGQHPQVMASPESSLVPTPLFFV